MTGQRYAIAYTPFGPVFGRVSAQEGDSIMLDNPMVLFEEPGNMAGPDGQPTIRQGLRPMPPLTVRLGDVRFGLPWGFVHEPKLAELHDKLSKRSSRIAVASKMPNLAPVP